MSSVAQTAPTDVLMVLFSHLEEEPTLTKLSMVCRRWNQVVNTYFCYPKPLREYLFKVKIPTLKIDKLHITPEMMPAPVMLVDEPLKRKAIAIKYHVILPDGRAGDLAIMLHEIGKGRGWRSTQYHTRDFYPKITHFSSPENKFVELSCLFRINWQMNKRGEFDYLRDLLEGKPCGRIVSEERTITEPTFKKDKGEEVPYIQLCTN